MNAIGAFILVVLTGVVFACSRRYALLGMMAGVMYLTQSVQIQLGFNFYAIRILELVAFVRVISRNEFAFHNLNLVDRTFLWVYGYTTVIFLLRSKEGVAYQVGVAVDAILCYFSFRGLVGGFDDFRWLLCSLIYLLIPYTALVIAESQVGHNLFTSIYGGSWADDFRNGRTRCTGSFREPDLLGMFAASFIPLYVSLACVGQKRMRAVCGVFLCLVLVWASNCGAAASGAGMGLFGWMFWRARTKMRKVRWGIVVTIVIMALIMKAPVWYIFAHISSITGGGGWHRSYLIDVSYRNLSLWWLAGMPLSETINWFPYHVSATGTADITDLYIDFGLTAGLGAMILFVLLLVRAYAFLGEALIRVRLAGTTEMELLLWGCGVMLVVHIFNWFGLIYFDQMYVVWFMQLAAISTLSERCFATRFGKPQENATLEAAPNMGSPVPI